MTVATGDPERVAHALGLVRDRVGLDGLRVLDLACRVGVFSAAFAAAGAEVLGVEGRQENLDHVPPGTSARFELGDVRDLSPARHGRHDVTLCLGVLYHLDAADAVGLLASMREVTARFAVVDTHVGADVDTVTVDGYTFRGRWYGEVEGHPWSSIDNARSWWFTADSFADAARAAEWAAVDHIPGPGWPGEAGDRRWFVIS